MKSLSFGEILLLAMALSADTFWASFAYGTEKIKIPPRSIVITNLIGSGILFLAALLGTVLGSWFPLGFSEQISFWILFLLGIVKLFDSTLKAWLRKQNFSPKSLRFSLFHLCFILQVYADPKEADQDKSRSLSLGECCSLAVALSLDGFAAGFGAGTAGASLGLLFLCNFLCGILSMGWGAFFGDRAAEKISVDISWLGGLLLIVLSLLR